MLHKKVFGAIMTEQLLSLKITELLKFDVVCTIIRWKYEKIYFRFYTYSVITSSIFFNVTL